MTDPTPQADQKTCPMCEFKGMPCPGGAHAYALYEDGIHSVEDYVRKCKPAEPSLAPQAERVIEVAPQDEIPGTVEWWTSDKPLVDRLHYYAAARGTAETALFVPDDILEILAMLSNSEASLTAAREERDRADTAHEQTLTQRDDAEEYIADIYAEVTSRSAEWSNLFGFDDAFNDIASEVKTLREERDRARDALRGYREHHDTYGSCRIEPTGDRRCKDCRRADSAALKPVSDRQPEEGEKP